MKSVGEPRKLKSDETEVGEILFEISLGFDLLKTLLNKSGSV